VKKFFFVSLVVLLVLVVAINTLASKNSVALTRQHDPVVLTGDQLSTLLGTATNEIFVYVFTSGTPEQIPFQIDEQNVDGMFIPNGDGLLGNTEELVFMGKDAGDYEPDPLLSTPGGDIYPDFVVTLSDPLSSDQAWAYIYTSSVLTPTFTADYVSYDGGNDRITSPGLYGVGFNATNSFRDYLTLGVGADILDRDKIRLEGYVFVPTLSFEVTENDITKDAVHAIDGPVRVTRVATSTVDISGATQTGTGVTFFYQALIAQPISLSTDLDPATITYVRNSIDFNATATGMTYYDLNNGGGVTINGTPDSITITPAAEWQQVSGNDGTMLTMVDLPGTLSGMSTYYKDDSAVDPNDTGDQLAYGDSGFQVTNPPQGQTYELLIQSLFLNGNQPNVGDAFFNEYLNPLDVQVSAFGLPTPTPTNTPTATDTPTVTLTPAATVTPSPTMTIIPPDSFEVYLPLVVHE